MTLNAQIRWYLVRFKPNSHKIAARNLQRQSFQTFLPMQDVTRRRAGKFHTVLQPLFPGYMFVSLDTIRGPWRQINATLGVSKLVSVAGRPQPVPNTLVNALLERCDEDGKLLPPETFSPGEQVRLRSGPFASFVATVEKMQPDRRVWLLLEFMGQATRIQVDADILSAEPTLASGKA